MTTRPWQVDWKRPLLHRVVEEGPTNVATRTKSEDDSSGSFCSSEGIKCANTNASSPAPKDETSSLQGRVVDHCAAEVCADEVLRDDLVHRHAMTTMPSVVDCFSVDHSNGSQDPMRWESDRMATFILTVTAVQTQAGRPADCLVLEVLKHSIVPPPDSFTGARQSNTATNPPPVERIVSRIVRWPSSALGGDFVDPEEFDEHDEDDDDDDSGGGGDGKHAGDNHQMGENHRKKLRKQRRRPAVGWRWFQPARKARPRHGIAAVTLCRLPEDDSTAPTTTEALDVVQLLALGSNRNTTRILKVDLNTENMPHESHTTMSDGQHNHDQGDDDHDGDDPDPTELMLAVLTTDGKIHLYDPWSLLNPLDGEKGRDGVEDSMASFLLGESLLSALNNTYLPLSQPVKTVTLSLPFLRRDTTHKGDYTYHDTNKSTSFHQSQTISMWDPSVWDSLLDKASLSFQTKHNKVTHCVAALDYLCIGGQGRRRRSNTDGIPSVAHTTDASIGSTLESAPSDDISASGSEGAASHASSSSSRLHNSGRASASGRSKATSYNGGFVTFISLRTFAETRTVYLPFVPEKISPLVWGGMKCLLVIGSLQAVLIRMDGNTPLNYVPAGEASPKKRDADAKQKTLIPIHRFQIIPIHLRDMDMSTICTITPTCTYSCPPAIVLFARHKSGMGVIQRAFHAIDIQTLPPHDCYVRYGHTVNSNQLAMVITGPCNKCVANIPDCTNTPWSQAGSGWCLLGAGSTAQFVCFEGATFAHNAFVERLTIGLEENTGFAREVLPKDPFSTKSVIYENPRSPVKEFVQFAGNTLAMPEDPANEGDDSLNDDLVPDALLETLRDNSCSSFQDDPDEYSTMSPIHHHKPVSSRERLKKLLQHCSSWRELEESKEIKEKLEHQCPVVSIRTGLDLSFQSILSFRKSSIHRCSATPFQSVLSWLSCNKDYFTAASLALDLLHDAQSLRLLWKACESKESEDRDSILEGLLDGISPLYDDGNDGLSDRSMIAQLADMTAGCLIKAGASMSPTLNHFLRSNNNYDPSRICLMLASVTSASLSWSMESPIITEEFSSFDHKLWAVRSLLQVGIARDSLSMAILLLNATVPHELRGRTRNESIVSDQYALELCRSLVALIVSCADQASQLLLDLVDDDTQQPFWESLNHMTRLELSLLEINGKFPLLRTLEVRSWVTAELVKCIESQADESIQPDLHPDDWLRKLGSACMSNAGCVLAHPTICDGYSDEATDKGPDGYMRHIGLLRAALFASNGTGGLDFDLVILCFLILEKRKVLWCPYSSFSTQDVLNVACYLAGRRNQELPLFEVNNTLLMRQCFRSGNVEAGAELIGGQCGLILRCCDILIKYAQMTMESAETFLVTSKIPASCGVETCNGSDSSFTIQQFHKVILFLISEHVLSIRKYGDFDSTYYRGKVDPVFAARMALLTWWFVTRSHLHEATPWLTDWLDRKLQLGTPVTVEDDFDHSHQAIPLRLACAAIVRALVWSREDCGSAPEDCLASRLKIPGQFIVRLSISCCGLVESLPGYVVKECWKEIEELQNQEVTTPCLTIERRSSGNLQSADQGMEVLNDSFQSTVSSLVDA